MITKEYKGRVYRWSGKNWVDVETNEMPPQAIREELNRLAKGEFGAFDDEKRRAKKRSPRVCPVCRELKNPDEYWPSERNNKWCKKCLSERGYRKEKFEIFPERKPRRVAGDAQIYGLSDAIVDVKNRLRRKGVTELSRDNIRWSLIGAVGYYADHSECKMCNRLLPKVKACFDKNWGELREGIWRPGYWETVCRECSHPQYSASGNLYKHQLLDNVLEEATKILYEEAMLSKSRQEVVLKGRQEAEAYKQKRILARRLGEIVCWRCERSLPYGQFDKRISKIVCKECLRRSGEIKAPTDRSVPNDSKEKKSGKTKKPSVDSSKPVSSIDEKLGVLEEKLDKLIDLHTKK